MNTHTKMHYEAKFNALLAQNGYYTIESPIQRKVIIYLPYVLYCCVFVNTFLRKLWRCTFVKYMVMASSTYLDLLAYI